MFAAVGHRVILGSRDVARAQHIAARLPVDGIRGDTYEAAAEAPVLLPAAFIRDGLADLLEPLRANLDGKLYIDITNPFNADYTDFILPWNTSGAEELQKRFPRARIVGAFKNVWWEVFDRPQFEGHVSDVFVVGDDAGAKAQLLEIVSGHHSAISTPARFEMRERLSE